MLLHGPRKTLKQFVNLHKTLAVHQPNKKKVAEETEDPNYWAIQKGIDVPYMLLHKKHCIVQYKRCVLKHETKIFCWLQYNYADIVYAWRMNTK